MNKQKYEKGGSAGSKGSQFQVHLLVVFLLNALRMRLPNWRLSTEDKRAGKFDDVVLEWSEGAVLLQAKHKENKKRITVEQLMSTTSKNDDFCIPKYFLSYREIKDKFPSLTKAVICTNASVSERALTFLNTQTDSSDSNLFCKGHLRLFYTLKDDNLSELKDKIRTYHHNITGRDIDETVIADENLKDFQKHFQIYFDYPSGDGLQNVIEQLLDGTNWRDKASVSEIYSKVMDWFQQKHGNFLRELHLRAMVSEIRRDKYWQSLKQYDVQFPNNDLNFEDSNRRYHFIAESTSLLQEIRIWQALCRIRKKALYIYLDDSKEDQKQLIEAFKLENYVVLIIIQTSVSVSTKMWHQIEEILNNFAYKKIVLCTERDNELLRAIQSVKNHFDVTKEPPTFEDLLEDVQDRLLNSKKILFQGNVTSLEELFAPESMRNYKASLGSEILERLVKGEEIKVGSHVRALEKEVERCYIRRNFIKANDERHEGNIFEGNDRLILIADNAGTGKSTTLTKLAVLIKERSPHLWVVKIILDHYSKFLNDSLRKPKTMVDIVEFLDSQEATRLTNQFDKLVFSLNNKVVLMLDGVDEMSPNYTELVESLLVNSLRAPNVIKIFATTRPYLAEKLEEKFQVKSFLLEPFSERNQIDFLSKQWMHNLARTDREKCEQYARALVQKMSSWTNSNFHWENDFAAIPLQVKMVAEIFQESGRNGGVDGWEGCKEFLNADRLEPKLPEKIDLIRLYKLFVEKKRDVFIKKFNPTGNVGAEQALVDQYEESLGYHRTLALEVIIVDTKIRHTFSCYNEGGKICKSKTLKIGIMQDIDNILRFIHRTFAEYLVAECLLIELQRHNNNSKFQKFLIDKVLRSRQFRMICIFFDGVLQDCVDSLPDNIFLSYQRLSYKSFGPDDICLIHDLAQRGCVAILRLVLKCVGFKIIKGKETSISSNFVRRYFGNKLKTLQLCVQRGGVNIRDKNGRTPLHIAAGEGHLGMVKFLLEQGAKINTTNGHTPLYEAASRGHSAIVEFLVEQADAIPRGDELCIAIYGNHVRIVNYFLDKILEDVNLERTLGGRYEIIPFSAAYLGRIDTLKLLVEKDMDVNDSIGNGQSLIFGAAMGGQLETLEYLVSQGADINIRDFDRNTVLHSISENSALRHIAKFLVDLGIDVDVKDKFGETALHVAVGAGAYGIAELLIKSGADVNSKEEFGGQSIIQTATFMKYLPTVELLAEHGADVNVKDAFGNTLLHSLTILQHLDIVKCLVKLGVNVTAKDKKGRTPLHFALEVHQFDVVEYLIECSNIDVNSKDNDGQTILHSCVSIKPFLGRGAYQMAFCYFAPQRLDIVKRLVVRGANFNLTNNRGQTVLHLAVLSVALQCNLSSCDHCLLVIKFLIEQGAGIDTKSSKGDVKIALAKKLQKDVRYRGQNLGTIFQLPIFKLLDQVSSLNHENSPPSNHLCTLF